MKTRAFVEALSTAIGNDLSDFKVRVNRGAKGVVDSVTIMFREKNDENGESTLGRYASMCKLLEHLGSVMTRYSESIELTSKPNFMSDFAKFNKETRLVLDELRKTSKLWNIKDTGGYTYLSYTVSSDYRFIGGFMSDVHTIKESEWRNWISSVDANNIINCMIDDYISKVGSKMKKVV